MPTDTSDDQQQDDGEVSEVGQLNADQAEDPISDSQSVAGSPSDESGPVDEGPTGPNSRAGSDRN